MAKQTVVVLDGDQTGQELLMEALRVLDSSVIGLELDFVHFDLSLAHRPATITPEGRGDVGSPNAILRAAIDGTVIVRTGRRIPGVRPVAGIHAPISVVRMAVGDAYGAKEWREGEGASEVAYRTERIERKICR